MRPVTDISTTPTTGADTARKLHELRHATQKFEALFTSMLLRAMRNTVPRSGLLSGGFQEDVFQMMLDNAIAENMAMRGNGLGIAKMLYDDLMTRVK